MRDILKASADLLLALAIWLVVSAALVPAIAAVELLEVGRERLRKES